MTNNHCAEKSSTDNFVSSPEENKESSNSTSVRNKRKRIKAKKVYSSKA